MNSMLLAASDALVGAYFTVGGVAVAAVVLLCVGWRCWNSVQETAGKGRGTQFLTGLQLVLVVVGAWVLMSYLVALTKPQFRTLIDSWGSSGSSAVLAEPAPAGK